VKGEYPCSLCEKRKSHTRFPFTGPSGRPRGERASLNKEERRESSNLAVRKKIEKKKGLNIYPLLSCLIRSSGWKRSLNSRRGKGVSLYYRERRRRIFQKKGGGGGVRHTKGKRGGKVSQRKK